MFKTIVWATDGSHDAAGAVELARSFEPERIVAVHCDERLTGRAGEFPALADEPERKQRIASFVDVLRERGVPVELVVRRTHASPADVVAEVARELDADLIVCGTRGFGAIHGALVGSVAQRLLHVAHCPVLAVPAQAHAHLATPPAAAVS
jgi:nucleotide-binding universal stress UspA family protein